MAPVEVNGKIGYWGEPTATLEWCEDNYEVTYYVAEFCKYNKINHNYSQAYRELHFSDI